MADTKVFTWKELEQHSSRKDIWLAIDGRVYGALGRQRAVRPHRGRISPAAAFVFMQNAPRGSAAARTRTGWPRAIPRRLDSLSLYLPRRGARRCDQVPGRGAPADSTQDESIL